VKSLGANLIVVGREYFDQPFGAFNDGAQDERRKQR
jgi:hypothetical protein